MVKRSTHAQFKRHVQCANVYYNLEPTVMSKICINLDPTVACTLHNVLQSSPRCPNVSCTCEPIMGSPVKQGTLVSLCLFHFRFGQQTFVKITIIINNTYHCDQRNFKIIIAIVVYPAVSHFLIGRSTHAIIQQSIQLSYN